jgi:hypothetical protein
VIPVTAIRLAKSFTMPRSKKALNFADIDEEPERQGTTEKLINTNLCLASIRSYADKPILKFRHFGN